MLKVSHTCVSNATAFQISLHFAFKTNRFQVTGHVEATTDPQLTLNATRSKVPHICFTRILGSQITINLALRIAFLCFDFHFENSAHHIYIFKSVSHYGKRFYVPGDMDTSTPNDPKMS